MTSPAPSVFAVAVSFSPASLTSPRSHSRPFQPVSGAAQPSPRPPSTPVADHSQLCGHHHSFCSLDHTDRVLRWFPLLVAGSFGGRRRTELGKGVVIGRLLETRLTLDVVSFLWPDDLFATVGLYADLKNLRCMMALRLGGSNLTQLRLLLLALDQEDVRLTLN